MRCPPAAAEVTGLREDNAAKDGRRQPPHRSAEDKDKLIASLNYHLPRPPAHHRLEDPGTLAPRP
jgi:hypothetical protein